MKHNLEHSHGHRLAHKLAHKHVTRRPTPARFEQTWLESLPMSELGAQIVRDAIKLYRNLLREPGSAGADGKVHDLFLDDDSEENQARLLKDEHLRLEDQRSIYEIIQSSIEESIPASIRDEINALQERLDLFHFDKHKRKNAKAAETSEIEALSAAIDESGEEFEDAEIVEPAPTLGRYCGFLAYPIHEIAEITGYDIESLKEGQTCLQRINPPGLGSDDMFHFHEAIANLFFADQPANSELYPGPHAQLYFTLRKSVESTWGAEASTIFTALRTLTRYHTFNNRERKGEARKKRSKKQIAKLIGISEEQAVAVLAILDRLPDGPLASASLDVQRSHKIKLLNRPVDFDLKWNDKQCRYVINGVPKWAEDVRKMREQGLDADLAVARMFLQQKEHDAHKIPAHTEALTEEQIIQKRFEEYQAICAREKREGGLSEKDEKRKDKILDEMERQVPGNADDANQHIRKKRRAKEYLTEREYAWWMLDKRIRAFEAKAQHLPKLVEKLVELQVEFLRTGDPSKRVILSRASLARELRLDVRKVQHWFLNLVLEVEGKRYTAEDLFITSKSQYWQSVIESIIESSDLQELLLQYCTYPWNGVTGENIWEILTHGGMGAMAERTARNYLKQVQQAWLQEGRVFPDKNGLLAKMIAGLANELDEDSPDALGEKVWTALTANFHARTQMMSQQYSTLTRKPKAITRQLVDRYMPVRRNVRIPHDARNDFNV